MHPNLPLCTHPPPIHTSMRVFQLTKYVNILMPFFLDDGGSNFVMAAVFSDLLRTATLTLSSPVLTIIAPSCLMFRYKANRSSTFWLTTQPPSNVTWRREGHSDSIWRNATFYLAPGTYRLIFKARGVESLVYLDDIQVLQDVCPFSDDG